MILQQFVLDNGETRNKLNLRSESEGTQVRTDLGATGHFRDVGSNGFGLAGWVGFLVWTQCDLVDFLIKDCDWVLSITENFPGSSNSVIPGENYQLLGVSRSRIER